MRQELCHCQQLLSAAEDRLEVFNKSDSGMKLGDVSQQCIEHQELIASLQEEVGRLVDSLAAQERQHCDLQDRYREELERKNMRIAELKTMLDVRFFCCSPS